MTLGFAVSSETEPAEVTADSGQTPNRRERSSAFVEEESEHVGEVWERLEKAQRYDAVSTSLPPQSDAIATATSEGGARDQQYSISSWSFSELPGQPAPQNYLRSSHDILYHSKEQVGADTPRLDSGDMRRESRDADDYSTSYPQDTSYPSRDKTHSDPHTRVKQKYSTMPSSDTTRGSTTISDLSRSGGKSGRLTSSEPTPKLQQNSEIPFYERGTASQSSRGLRRFSSHEQPQFHQRNPFGDSGSLLHNQSSGDAVSSRMRLPGARLGSVQEQPSEKPLNPFDDSHSTNPFDMEDSTASNPFGAEDDEDEFAGADKERWTETKSSNDADGGGFSRNEERYFPDYQSQHSERSKDDTDFELPPSTHAVPPPSSSVPAHSHMSHFAAHRAFANTPRDHRMPPKKSSTLPYGRSPRAAQENPELTKRSAVTLPRGKPPIPGGLVRGKSMESLDRCSPRNEQHPLKSNRIVSPHTRKRWEDPYMDDSPGAVSGEKGLLDGGDWSQRNSSTPPSARNSSSGSGKSTPEVTRRGHSSSDTQNVGRGKVVEVHPQRTF